MDQEFADLEPHERQLTARSSAPSAGSIADVVDERIFWLVTRRLTARARSADGWTALFLDPRDGRYWELSFPQGSLFGGGPRLLTWLPAAVAKERYGDAIRD